MKRFVALILLLGLSFPGMMRAEPAPTPMPSPSPEPLVTITSPPSAKARKYYLFPLKIPAYVLQGVTWPLVQALRFVDRRMERKGFTDTNKKKKSYSVMPILQAGGGEGVGLGASFQWEDMFHAGDLSLDYTFFLDVDNRAGLSFTSDPIQLGGRPLQFEFVAHFRNREALYFGVGSDTKESDAAVYSYNQFDTGVNLQYEIFKNLHLTLPLQIMTADTGPGTSKSHPSVQFAFPPSELVAFQDRTNYFITGLGIAHDTRDSSEYPLKGGYRSFDFLRFQDLGGDFSFNQYRVDLRQYFPLWAERYVLGLRNAWVFQQADGGRVPFNLLSSLDHYSPMRGFQVGRFRDTSSVVFNLEYQFPIWSYQADGRPNTKKQFIDGLLFFDTGRVFSGIKDFAFEEWHYAGGGGVNLLFNENSILRFQAGYGGEGALLFLSIGKSL